MCELAALGMSEIASLKGEGTISPNYVPNISLS